jgi:hypothetical protein
MTLAQARCVLSGGKAPRHPGAPAPIHSIREHAEEQARKYEADPFAFPARGGWAGPN